MKNWAKIDSKNQVIDMLVVSSEKKDAAKWLQKNFGGTWIQASDSAAIGDTYEKNKNAFIGPRPFNSWILNNEFQWEAPSAKPDDQKRYSWDEENQIWVERIIKTD